MDCFYPFKIRSTFALSNNDKVFFDLLIQKILQKAEAKYIKFQKH